ncbi:MAG: magnesium transporter [Clostridia bacterium]|nr:magnesium transporter [Clostridia bacterium]
MEIEEVKNLLENKKFNILKNELKEMNSADIPSLLEELDKESVVKVFRILSKEQAGEAFSYMEPDMKEKLIHDLTDAELRNVMDELFMDDTVDLIEEMPSNVVKKILKVVNKDDRKTINELLQYPEDSAGSIMTTEFVDLKENMTVEEALERIRTIGLDSETIFTCYVLNKNRILLGIVSIKDILIAKPGSIIKDLMVTNIISVNTKEDQEEVTKVFDKYDFFALPVVDNENRLVGIITVDDAINVIQDEVAEDFEKMAAMSPTEDGYFETSVFKHAKNRIVWLLILMLSAAVTGAIITRYEQAFATVPLLVAFIPMIMGTGGNCGSQSSTLIIRGLATDEIELKDVFKALWKELRVSLMVGVVLAFVNGIRIMLQYQDLQLAIVIGLTLIATVILAKALGCLLPLLAKKLKLDPAIMASPLITTLVDIFSILVYFQIATGIMGI